MNKKLIDEIFAVYKPKGMTSHDAIDVLRHLLRKKRIGHAGTLDPLAEGVLVIGVERGTKQLQTEVQKEKEYLATIQFGATSLTDDAEGEIHLRPSVQPPMLSDIQMALKSFVGSIAQRPPDYSAVKIRGKEAYKRKRAGERITLPMKRVNVKSIRILSYQWPQLQLNIVTGPGVYIRSIARDLGERLGCGGFLAQLKRTRVGSFTEKNAFRFSSEVINEARRLDYKEKK